MAKCKWCGKEFEARDNRVYCSWDCRYMAGTKRGNINQKIKNIARKYDFDVKNKNKIINAKMMMFAGGDLKRCPCLSQDPDHYCGSARCIADTVYQGHCCCRLFWSKKEPLLKQYVEKFND